MSEELQRHPITRALVEALLGVPLNTLRDGPGVDADGVLRRSDELGVFPITWLLTREVGAPTPSWAESRWREHVACLALVRNQLVRARAALGGIPHVVLKGEALSQRIFETGLARSTTDVDLLVAEADVDEAVDRLCEAGWERIPGTAMEPWHNNQLPLRQPVLAVRAEVHWRLALRRVPCPTTSQAIATAVHHAFGDDVVPVLRPDNGLLYACLHHHHHIGFAKGLLDIAGWLDSHGAAIDLERFGARATELGLRGIVTWPLGVLAELTPFELPASLGSPDPLVRMWIAWSTRSVRGLLTRSDAVGSAELVAWKVHGLLRGHFAAWNMLAMTLLDGGVAKARGVFESVGLTPRAVAAQEGRKTPLPRDYLRLLTRPAALASKQLVDLWRGRRK